MVPAAIVVLVIAAACGRVGFDARAGDAGPAGDMEDAACELGPWTTPVEQVVLNTAGDDWEPALHPDGNVLVFVRSVNASVLGMYAATRSGDAFINPAVIPTLTGDESGPAWSPDGDQLFMVRDPLGGNEFKLHVSDYVAGVIEAPVAVTELASETMTAPAFANGGLELYWSTPVSSEIRRAERSSLSAPWVVTGTEAQLTLIGTTVGWPTVSADSRALYYEVISNNLARLYVATRGSTSERFGTPSLVSELGATSVQVGDPDLSRDDRSLVFALHDMTTASLFDIYISKRSCL